MSVNFLPAALFASAFVWIQLHISGTRLAFSLPPYALIGVAGVLSLFCKRDVHSRTDTLCCVATIAFFSYVLCRALASPVGYLARTDTYMVLACLVVYGVTAACVTDRQLRGGILTTMFALALAEAMMGAWQFAQRDGWVPFGLTRPSGGWRASGTFVSPIHFAGLLEALGPVAVAFALWGTQKFWVRTMAGICAVIWYAGVIFSGSRGAWVSASISLLALAVIAIDVVRRSRRQHLAPAVYCAIMGAMLVSLSLYFLIAQSTELRGRMEAIADIGEKPISNYDIRIHNWQAALDQWRESRWIGTGAGTHLYYGRQFRRPQLQSDPEHAHNDYLELLAEYGVVGAIGMAAFLFAHLRSGSRAYRKLANLRREEPYRASPELALTVGALSAVAGYLAHSAVDFNLHLPGNALLFAFYFGVLANPGSPPATHEGLTESDPDPLPLAWRLVLPSLGALLCFVALTKYPGEYWCEKARVAIRDNRHADAIRFARRGIESETRNPFLFYHLGQALRLRARALPESTKDFDGLRAAAAAFRAGIALFERDEDLWIRLGQTLDDLADYENARAAYLRAIELDPRLAATHAYFAIHLRRVGRDAEADAVIAEGSRLAQWNVAYVISQMLANAEGKNR
jgi:O-antigen ligase